MKTPSLVLGIFLILVVIFVTACSSTPSGNGGSTPSDPSSEGPAEPAKVKDVTGRPIRMEWVNLDPRRQDPPLGLINRSSPELRELYRNPAAWVHVKPVDDETIGVLLDAFREEGFFEFAKEGRSVKSLRMGEGKGAICVMNGDKHWALIFGPGMSDTEIPELYVRLKHNIIHVHRTTLWLAPASDQDPNRTFRIPTNR
jgi:hypothetical protein